MKTILISLFTATLLGLASQFSDHSVNVAEITSMLFVAGLLAWTVKQYSRQPLNLTPMPARPIHLPVRSKAPRLPAQAHQLAA